MNLASRTAVVAALVLCGTSIAGAPAAAAPKASQQEAQPEHKFTFSKEEQEALYKLQEAIKTKDPAAIGTALQAAEAAAQGADARYALSTLRLDAGRTLNDQAMQLRAVDELIASGRLPEVDLPTYLRIQFNAAIEKNDIAKAETALARLVQVQPNDVDALTSMGRLRLRQNQFGEAASQFEKAIALQQSAGQTVPETLYKMALSSAYRAHQLDDSMKLSRELVRAYPNAENWRSALLIYRELAKPDKATELDAFRLMRFTQSMTDAADFVTYAQRLNSTGYPGEAATVLEEGLATNKLNPSTPGVRELRSTASSKLADDKQGLPAQANAALAAPTGDKALSIGDAYFGYGDYARAVELYRAALEKGSVDADLVNTRLGMALALLGRKAEAQAAFDAVSGPRAKLAEFMKLWASQRA